MADRDYLTVKYKTAEFESLTYGERVEKLQVLFDGGFILDVEVMQDNRVDIDFTYPDGENITLEAISKEKIRWTIMKSQRCLK